jgi:Peptidase A4 family
MMILAALPAVSFSTLAAAQSDAVRAVYDQSAIVPTNVEGVRTFNAPPRGFNALTASDEELATFGFPPRPNKQNDAAGYARWAKAMLASKVRWNGQLQHTGAYSRPAELAHAPAGAGASATPGTLYYYNWSGFVNTNTLKKYNAKTSFYTIWSEFNVPVVNQPSGSCDGGWDWEVSWNGIDGNQDQNALLQGGSSSEAYCSGKTKKTAYFAWVEWWPAYDILEEFTVNPGDDLYVVTWDTSATQGYVYLVDETLGVSGTYGLTPNGGAGLIGNSAEYIVERPCCRGSNDYPLANYVWNFWAQSYADNFTQYNNGTSPTNYPGSTAATNYLTYMVDDGDTQIISAPEAQGKYGIFFYADNCAFSGGCTP